MGELCLGSNEGGGGVGGGRGEGSGGRGGGGVSGWVGGWGGVGGGVGGVVVVVDKGCWIWEGVMGKRRWLVVVVVEFCVVGVVCLLGWEREVCGGGEEDVRVFGWLNIWGVGVLLCGWGWCLVCWVWVFVFVVCVGCLDWGGW